MKNINPIIRWWVTPELPPEDVFASHNFISQWITHPIKRRLARVYIRLLKKFTKLTVIGVTGSTGKTTTTEILASILSKDGKTIWSAEGVDPVYNIPNTILRTSWGTKYLILEMSVEYMNEMNYYLWLVKPDVAVVTNIATTHTQYLMNKEGVAREKSKLVKGLSEDGTTVLNAEDPVVNTFSSLTKAKVFWFGDGSSVRAEGIRLQTDLTTFFTLIINKSKNTIHMKAYGSQYVANAVTAAACAHSLNITDDKIKSGLENFRHPVHRLSITKTAKSGIIFDDSYNSNPKAAVESLETFNKLSTGKIKIAVIGDMLELGKFEESAHRELGKKVAESGFDYVIGVGTLVRSIIEETEKSKRIKGNYLCSDVNEAISIVRPLLNSQTSLFVKGSRSIGLDKLVDAIILKRNE